MMFDKYDSMNSLTQKIMSKIKTSFFCQNCGAQYAKWQGQCNSCKNGTPSPRKLSKTRKSSLEVKQP
jgi:DNA repair protein RadA/Sms